MSSKLSDLDINEIANLYESGVTGAELSLTYGISRPTILNGLRKHGVKIRPTNNISLISYSTEKEIIDLYLEGYSSVYLSKKFNYCFGTILNVLKRNNIPIRDNVECQRYLNINDSAFSVLTPEARYWAGFLMADGGICKNRITLTLSNKDADHVYKFRSFLQSEHKIRANNSGMTCYTAVSLQIVKDLAKLGIVERKTFIAKCCGELAYCHDFWRGVIDGDGSIAIIQPKNRPNDFPQLTLVGSQYLVKQFTDYLNQHCSTNKNMCKPTNKSIWHISCSYTTAIKIIKILYGNNPIVSLSRKQIIADQILAKNYTFQPTRRKYY